MNQDENKKVKTSVFFAHNMSTSFSQMKKNKKRVGRGISSNQGKTCGRGTKGQNARGSGTRLGFEGGQTPLYRRLPKRGFTNIHAKKWQTVNLKQLTKFENKSVIDAETLYNAKIIKNFTIPVKIIGDFPIKKAFTVKVQKISKGALKVIEANQGTVTLIK